MGAELPIDAPKRFDDRLWHVAPVDIDGRRVWGSQLDDLALELPNARFEIGLLRAPNRDRHPKNPSHSTTVVRSGFRVTTTDLHHPWWSVAQVAS
jgi:hypothetical protein